jgi:hypothetical protein
MTRVDVSDGWTVRRTVPEVQAALLTFLRGRGMWVTGQQAGEVHARQGSWLGRVLGGRLSPAKWLPKMAVVKLNPGDSGVAVRARIEDAAGAALTGRTADKYRAYFERWMGELKAVLS